MRATKSVISLDNLKHNLEIIKNFIDRDTLICAAVKADSYGHGAVQCAKCLLKNGVSYLAVAAVEEAIILRESGIMAPILVLTLPQKTDADAIIEYALTPLVFDKEFISNLNAHAESLGEKVSVHLKIDTGMGRAGCFPEEAAEIAAYISGMNSLVLEGVCTHLAVSDSLDPDNIAFTRNQIAAFSCAVDAIKAAGINPGICHCSSSAGTFLYPEAHFSMVRPGITLYGYLPDPELKPAVEKALGSEVRLKPVMQFTTKVVAIKKFKKDQSVSYGRTWIAEEDCDIAVLPAGYADGVARILSNKIRVLINGKEYPLVGRICMDQCMVDIGKNSGIKVGDEVILFGWQEGAETADDWAAKAGTISYELLCNINKRVPRIYSE